MRAQVRADVENLQASIDNLHHLVLGHHWEGATSGGEDGDLLPTRDLLSMITSVAGGVQVMKVKQAEMTK